MGGVIRGVEIEQTLTALADSLCNELERIAEDPSILVLIARVYQVWRQKS